MPIHDLIAGQTTTVIEPKPFILPISLKPWCLLPELLQCNACSCLYWGSIWQASGNASLARGMHWYTYNSHISSLSGTLHLFCRSLDIPKMFLMTTPGILLAASWVCHLSQILARVGISVQHPSIHPTTARRGSIATCRMSSFMLIHITCEQALTANPPTPTRDGYRQKFCITIYQDIFSQYRDNIMIL